DGSALHAMAGIEIACFDILGKSLGKPLHELLGGARRDRIRAYANAWYQGPREPEFFAQRAREVVAMGYTALKFDPFGAAYGQLPPEEEDLSVGIVAAVSEAVGPEVHVLVEAHDRFDVPTAIRLAERLAEHEPTWLETPVNSEDLRSLGQVADLSPVPIASGEKLRTVVQFRDMLETTRVRFIQPEPLNVGGVIQTRRVADLVEQHGALMAPHSAQGPVDTVICVHLDACCDRAFIQETFDDFHVDWARDLFDPYPEILDGYLHVPQAPGIGISLNEEAAAAHPYRYDNILPLFEVGWEQRTGKGGLGS
ncbi:MAG: mandelate racemase/muconate lactonizing enzyme family protein, partial [Armatimonadota bacterium]